MNDMMSDADLRNAQEAQATPREMRESALADVATRDFYHAMGYENVELVPEAVRKATAQSFQIALHGLDLPILNLDPAAQSVVLLGVDGGKYNKDDASKVIGKMKALFPRAKVISYDSRYTQVKDIGTVHDRLSQMLSQEMPPTAEQILQVLMNLAADENAKVS